MRILHVADLHLQHAWFDWIASHCGEFDLLVIAGDLQDAFSHTPMHDQARTITTWLLLLAAPVVVCSGNHDHWIAPRGDPCGEGGWLRRLRRKGKVIGVDGATVCFQGLKIAVNGWLQKPHPRERIDVLVTHAPPAGCSCASGSERRDVGDPESGDATKLFPPRLLLAWHVHEPGRLWCRWPASTEGTLVLVPGCNEHTDIVPAHWIVDTDAQLAVHNSGQTAELPRAQP